ncbi:MAG: glycoside hydrolase [Verrucomicrobiota bacterium]
MSLTKLSLLTAFLSTAALALPVAAQTSSTPPTRQVIADLDKPAGPLNTMFKACVGAGRANEGLRADWQRQLAFTRRECGFEYIRMHGLFTDDMGVYREDKNGRPEYNWQYIDELYDFLQRIGMKPFVELGFMPQALASGNKTIFWWRGNVELPKDFSKWEQFIRAFVLHVQERYGVDEVKSWYFEVWNEPNLSGFFNGTQADYFKLYNVTARAIKGVSPAYRVGGPATAGCAWVPDFINYCASNRVPVDFITTHSYAVDQGFLDEFGVTGTLFSPNPKSIYGEIRQVRDQIQSSPLPNLELHFTEWSSSYTPSDPLHDSYCSASFIVDRCRHAGTAAQSMSYWTFTDIFEESAPRWTPFHGGFGLINYQDILKPSFRAYQYMNRLGPTELQCADDNSWICRDNHGGIQALIWDFTRLNQGRTNNQVFYRWDLPSRTNAVVQFELRNVPPGRYGVAWHRTGYRSDDPYATYLDLGLPAQLTRSQVDYIRAANPGTPFAESLVTVGPDRTLRLNWDLRANDLYLLTFTPL